MRKIGSECAQILEDCVREIHPGETELEAAGRVTGRLVAKGYQVPVCLVASDERMYKYRHPLPTEKKIEKYAMIAICGQKYGLTISISRIISFGPVPEEIQKKYEALLKIDAAYIAHTLPGVLSKDVLEKGYEAYKEQGYEQDFHLHHQGGALGYLTRDYCCLLYTSDKMVNSLNVKTFDPGKQTAGTLSGGNQQKIVFAKWVLREPQIFLLDEPTRGVDVGAKYEIYTIIQELAKKNSCVLMVSSEIEELMGVCDRILVMSNNRITGELTKDEYVPEEIMKFAVGGVK